MTPMTDVIRLMAHAYIGRYISEQKSPYHIGAEIASMRAALTAALEHGWKLVPVEADSAIMATLADAIVADEGTPECWRRAVAAAPRWEP